MTAVSAMNTAGVPYTARQPAKSATTPANVLDSRMPISRPPISVPITRLRSWSLASVAAYGTSIWTTTDVTQHSATAASSTGRLGANAAPTSAMAQNASSPVSSGRRRMMSPAGTMNSSPTAYPSCPSVTSSAALPWPTCRESPMECSSGWA